VPQAGLNKLLMVGGLYPIQTQTPLRTPKTVPYSYIEKKLIRCWTFSTARF